MTQQIPQSIVEQKLSEAEALAEPQKVFCAWCPDNDGSKDLNLSHGICPTCKAAMLKAARQNFSLSTSAATQSDKRGMAATVEEGTAPKRVLVNDRTQRNIAFKGDSRKDGTTLQAQSLQAPEPAVKHSDAEIAQSSSQPGASFFETPGMLGALLSLSHPEWRLTA